MDPNVGQPLFLSLATIGLGFSALVSVLGLIRRTSGTLAYQDVQGIRFMMEHSFIVILFSLLTVALSFSSRFHQSAISIASVLLSLVFLGFVAFEVWRVLHDRRRGKPGPRHPWLFLCVFFLPQTAIGLWLLTSGRGSLVWYSGALIWPLIPVATQFLTFVNREAKK
jgi:hypothetical protein